MVEAVANSITEIYKGVEDECIKSIVKRLTAGKEVTKASVWQMKKLSEVGALSKHLTQQVSTQIGKSVVATGAILERAIYKASELDFETRKKAYDALMQNVKAGVKPWSDETITTDDMDAFYNSLKETEQFKKILNRTLASIKSAANITGTRAVQASIKAYKDAINVAYLEMATGNYSYEDAVKRAVERIGKSGIKIVDSKDKADAKQMVKLNGEEFTTYMTKHGLRLYPLDSAIRRDLTTTINHACGEITLVSAGEMGTDLVETSWHIGARPEHEKWQGKVFSLKKDNKKYPYFYAPQEEGGTGYGTMLGLCGINCYHSFDPYFEGSPRATDKNKPTKEENAKAYAEQQQQRAYERQLRALKREQLAYKTADMEDEARQADSKVRKVSKEYRQFLKDTGRTRVTMLDKISGYGRKSIHDPSAIPNPSPNPPKRLAKPRTPTTHAVPLPPTLENLDKHQAQFLKDHKADYSVINLSHYQKVMQTVFKKGVPSMRIDAEVLDIIADSDYKFKNQFETRTSGGALSYDWRKKASNNMFAPTSLKGDIDREKYGCLLDRNFKDVYAYDIAGGYGDCVVQFKDSILKRTTFSLGDSLSPAGDGDMIPSRVDKLSPSAIPCYSTPFKSKKIERIYNKLADYDTVGEINDDLVSDYIELQYHGDVTLDDVKSVCFKSYPEQKTVDVFKSKGISVYLYNGSSVVQL